MNLPTILVGLAVLAVFTAVVARGIYNRRHGKGGCSCGSGSGCCGDCARCRHSCDNKEE